MCLRHKERFFSQPPLVPQEFLESQYTGVLLSLPPPYRGSEEVMDILACSLGIAFFYSNSLWIVKRKEKGRKKNGKIELHEVGEEGIEYKKEGMI